MIYAEEALRQIAELEIHYETLNRPEATRALLAALVTAEESIASRPERGLLAPRPYPTLARAGRRWTKAGRYWIRYSTTDPPVILAVFYDAANIPGRLPPE